MADKNKQYAVIGLGRFGGSVCKELYRMGHQVLAIDKNVVKINEFTSHSTHAAIADATDENLLQSLGIQNFDDVIVAIGDDIQSSILITLLLKEMSVKNVWVKAQDSYHHKVLDKIGADRIIHPEQEMGIRIAQHLTSEKVVDYIDLSVDYSILELLATRKIDKRSLAELEIRAKFGCTILAIKRKEDVNISPQPNDLIYENDVLIVMGHNEGLNRFEEIVL